jgi:hypothetical protein
LSKLNGNALDVLKGRVKALRALLLDAQEGLAGCVGGLARCLQLQRLLSSKANSSSTPIN